MLFAQITLEPVLRYIRMDPLVLILRRIFSSIGPYRDMTLVLLTVLSPQPSVPAKHQPTKIYGTAHAQTENTFGTYVL